jgi:hypothetical protein
MIVDQVLANMRRRLTELNKLEYLSTDDEAYRDFLRREIQERYRTQSLRENQRFEKLLRPDTKQGIPASRSSQRRAIKRSWSEVLRRIYAG